VIRQESGDIFRSADLRRVEANNASGLARIVRTRIDGAVAENTRRIFRRL